MRTTAGASQVAIRRAATDMFCERGYRAATLEEIGARVGITRGAVLHHFRSKADLLASVTEPYLGALAQLLANAQVSDPPTADQRRQLITDLTDLFVEHRGAVRLLVNDIGARVELGLGDRWDALRTRLNVLLFGHAATAHDKVRVAAALGALCQPVAASWLNVGNPQARQDLFDAAMGVLGGTTAVVAK
jgi:AcrR family transcriptional regulator